ncbi:ABC transporter permease [Acuticoccus sediminis]|uniref:ABC transporter permease n=1 Tax=Acuticoccus sediminis TaxID=2184697 RepID=A0A8B2NTQ8_9HYPH|nr:ABC transporter permease [Acuticoccus sediminis]RAI03588.1 ABC transporter permease [Acuticoccus sediminis]
MARRYPRARTHGAGLAWSVAALVLVFVLAPLAVVVMMSFSTSEFVRFPPPGYGLEWFRNFLGRDDWTGAALRSVKIGAIVTVLAVAIGVPGALSLAALPRRLGAVAAALTTLPILMPPIVLALAMYMSFTRYGLAGTELGIVLGHLCLALPFVLLTTLATLRGIDPNLARAAQTLGAGRARVAFTVTIPLAMPGILAGAVLAFLTSFDELLIALFVGNSTTRTLPRRMWEGIRSEFDPTVAAASTVVVGATVLIGLVFLIARSAWKARAS